MNQNNFPFSPNWQYPPYPQQQQQQQAYPNQATPSNPPYNSHYSSPYSNPRQFSPYTEPQNIYQPQPRNQSNSYLHSPQLQSHYQEPFFPSPTHYTNCPICFIPFKSPRLDQYQNPHVIPPHLCLTPSTLNNFLHTISPMNPNKQELHTLLQGTRYELDQNGNIYLMSSSNTGMGYNSTNDGGDLTEKEVMDLMFGNGDDTHPNFPQTLPPTPFQSQSSPPASQQDMESLRTRQPSVEIIGSNKRPRVVKQPSISNKPRFLPRYQLPSLKGVRFPVINQNVKEGDEEEDD